MLRRLVIMRHAKSSPASVGEPDHERPLNKKGLDDARSMGEKLREREVTPELVLCSDSQRTRETWAQIAGQFDEKTPFVESPELYESSVQDYCDAICSQDFDAQVMLVVGHNPTIEQFVAMYSGKRIEIKPSEVVILEVDSQSWDEAFAKKRGHWALIEHIE